MVGGFDPQKFYSISKSQGLIVSLQLLRILVVILAGLALHVHRQGIVQVEHRVAWQVYIII